MDGPHADFYGFAKDVPFKSPSAAAAVVFAGNHCPLVWKTKIDGQSYGDWQAERLSGAGVKARRAEPQVRARPLPEASRSG